MAVIHYSLIGLLSATLAEAAALRSTSEKIFPTPRSNVTEWEKAFMDQDIFVFEGYAGCSILMGRFLGKSPSFHFALDKNAEVVETTFEDEDGKEYEFVKEHYSGGFYGSVGRRFRGEKIVARGVQGGWELLEEADLLPLTHLPPEAKEVLKQNLDWDLKRHQLSKRNCLAMAEAILNNPPSGYKNRKPESWIPQFYRKNAHKMREIVGDMKNARVIFSD